VRAAVRLSLWVAGIALGAVGAAGIVTALDDEKPEASPPRAPVVREGPSRPDVGIDLADEENRMPGNGRYMGPLIADVDPALERARRLRVPVAEIVVGLVLVIVAAAARPRPPMARGAIGPEDSERRNDRVGIDPCKLV
jgi:hypothetical protein